MRRLSALLCLCLAFGLCRADDAALSRFLESEGMESYRLLWLEHRLSTAPDSDLAAIAADYAAAIAEAMSATPAEERASLRAKASALFDRFPLLDAPTLRLDLALDRFSDLEARADAARLAALPAGENDPVAAELRGLRREFASIAATVPGARLSDDEARRASMARYYAGWTALLLAERSASPEDAGDALRHFARVLDQDSIDPRLDLVSDDLLALEHVARAAIGVALARAVRQEPSAIAWIDRVASSSTLSDSLRGQLPELRLRVLLALARWADIRSLAAESQTASPGLQATAALALRRALETGSAGAGVAAESDPLASRAGAAAAALADLLLRSDRPDLVLALGSLLDRLPDSDGGASLPAVRGLRAFDEARAQHRAADATLVSSATGAAREAYERAEADLRRAAGSGVVSSRAVRQRVALALGLTLVALDRPDEATAAFDAITDGPLLADAMWMRVVLAERLEGPRSESFIRRARGFLQAFPADPRGAALAARLDDDPEAIARLRSLAAEDPAAAMDLAAILYRRLVAATTAEPGTAQEFRVLAARLLLDGTQRTSPAWPVFVRQTLDVALRGPADVSLARASLAESERDDTSSRLGRVWPSERALRRVQLALAEGLEGAELGPLLEAAARAEEPYRAAALALLLSAAERADDPTAWAIGADAAVAARRGALPAAQTAFRQREALLLARLWTARKGAELSDRLLAAARPLAAANEAPPPVQRAYAAAAEDAGLAEEGARAWLACMRAVPEGSEPWFEARVRSLKLLSETDPAAAAVGLEQFVRLYPSLGPEPWATTARELAVALRVSVPATEAAP